ncbi:DUF2292 domain-containing protein [Candidatus Parcubacteria bacterium]|nr:DUF2292 domain-containing protein [Candidatus Parcubacteria bacterium]
MSIKELTKTEIKLIKYIRDLNFGRITIVIARGQPTDIEESTKKIRLTT